MFPPCHSASLQCNSVRLSGAQKEAEAIVLVGGQKKADILCQEFVG